MSRKLPGYRHHKASGQGYTSHRGKSHYFGPFNSPKSLAAYARFISELTALKASNAAPVASPLVDDPTVNELCLAFWEHVQAKHVKDGKVTSEVGEYKQALAPLIDVYGDVMAREFGPVALTTIRAGWLSQGLARKTINRRVAKIVRCFKWGVSRQVVSATVWQALTSLESLRSGQGIDYAPVQAVAEDRIHAVKPFVSRQVWAMIQFQLWTGCRPHEACQVRMADIDTTRPIWEYRPSRFKTQHHARATRIVFIGPHAQQIVNEWRRDDPTELLWQPREARAEWLAAHGSTKRHTVNRAPGAAYTTTAYGRAIERGCERAFGMPDELRRNAQHPMKNRTTAEKQAITNWRRAHCWSPNQLRHAAATRIRATYGIEVARIILGHSSAFTTEIYAEQDRQKILNAVAELG